MQNLLKEARNSGNADAIKGRLKELAAKSKNIKSEKDKAIHLAAFAQIGDMVDTDQIPLMKFLLTGI